MKQILLLFFTLFFSYSNAQSPLFKKDTHLKRGIEKSALRTSGNIVVLIDSSTYESKSGFERSVIEYTDFGYIGIAEEKDRGETVWSKDELFFIYTNESQQADSVLVYDKDNDTGDWKNYVGDKYIYEYDANGNEISELRERYRDSTVLSYKEKRLSFYNNDNLLDSTSTYYLTNNQWIERYYTQYNYSNEGLLSKISCDIDALSNTKTRCDSTHYYYNDRLLVDSAFQWRDNNLSYKEIHFQDAHGNDTLIAWYSWSERLNSWELSNKDVYTYDYKYSTEDLVSPYLIYDDDMKNIPLTYTYISIDFENDVEDSSTVYFYYSEKNITAISNEKIDQPLYYPNPASSTIEVSEEVSKTNILDLYGKPVLKSDLKTIDVSELSNGSYILLLETGKGVTSEKLIISK